MMDPSQLDYFAHLGTRVSVKLGPTVDPDTDWSRWKTIYPQYIDAKKSRPEGRRIATAMAVDSPTIDELGQMCGHFKLPYVLEYHKAYSRDWINPGRLRVILKNENGQYLDPDIRSKKTLMIKMAALIPQLKSRVSPPTRQAAGGQASGSKSKKKKK